MTFESSPRSTSNYDVLRSADNLNRCKIFSRVLRTVLTLLIFMISLQIEAADPQKSVSNPYSNAFFVHGGTILPQQVGNLSDQTSMFGLNWSIPFRETNLDLGFYTTNIDTSGLTNMSFGFRTNSTLNEDLYQVFLIGGDIWHFKTNGTSHLNSGFHIGGGLAHKIADDTSFRMDIKLNLSPGTSLYIGLGLEYQMGSSESKVQ